MSPWLKLFRRAPQQSRGGYEVAGNRRLFRREENATNIAETTTRIPMKSRPLHYAGMPAVAALVMTCGAVHGQTSKFTYQGKLSDAGVPANGDYEIKFGLADALSGGSVFSTLTKDPVTVSDGVFTVELDYGSAPFIGFDRWIEISVRPSGSADPFEVLSPRQALTSTPYAMHAGSVNASGLIGQVTDANLAATFTSPRSFTNPSNTFHGNGANLTALNATSLATGTLADGRLSPNAALLNRSPQAFTGATNSFSGNVGIGTPAPGGKLHVSGDGSSDNGKLIVQTTGGDYGPQLRLNHTGSGGEDWVLVSNGPINQGGVGQFGLVQGSTGLSRFVVSATGNVGLGVGSPLQKLHVAGQGIFAASTAAFDPGGAVGPALHAGYSLSGDYGYINAVNTGVVPKNLALQPGAGGNVGIGNINPGSKLTVSGIVESRSGGIKFPNGTVQTTAAIGSTTEYLKLGPGCYVTKSGAAQVANDWGDGVRIASGSTTEELMAPIHLPAGARILSMTAYVNDTVATNLRFAIFMKVNGGPSDNGTGFDFTLSTSAGYANQTFTPASPHVVNNSQSYYLNVQATGGSWPLNTSLAINNVVITWDRP